jgi:anti-sigma factor RsiW
VSFFRNRTRARARDDEPVELAGLADGSLSPEQQAALEARVAASPELAEQLAEQRRALAMVHRATADVEAPARLRARIETQRQSGRRRSRRTFALGTGIATATAAALVLLLVLPGGAGGPSIAAAADLGTRAATGAAPPRQTGEPKLLAREVGGVPFPNWQEKFGWRASGERADIVGGRRTATVF